MCVCVCSYQEYSLTHARVGVLVWSMGLKNAKELVRGAKENSRREAVIKFQSRDMGTDVEPSEWPTARPTCSGMPSCRWSS